MHTTNTRGQKLFYRTLGEGEPVLLLPGSSQSHVAFVDSGLPEALAPHFTVCLMDFTGMGASERVGSIEFDQWGHDVVSVLDAAGFSRAHLLGTTLGARVAARVALEHPDRVATLGVDMPITGVSEEQEERISAMFADYADSPLATGWQRWHGEQWTAAMDAFVGLRSRADFREHFSPGLFLDRITAPTFLCRSDEENLAHPLQQSFDWHSRAQVSQLWIEPGAGNMALTSACANEVAERFTRFVETHSVERHTTVGSPAGSS